MRDAYLKYSSELTLFGFRHLYLSLAIHQKTSVKSFWRQVQVSQLKREEGQGLFRQMSKQAFHPFLAVSSLSCRKDSEVVIPVSQEDYTCLSGYET